jgi:hypothetical protein
MGGMTNLAHRASGVGQFLENLTHVMARFVARRLEALESLPN